MVVWFFVIIIPTPVLAFDLDFDWGVAKIHEGPGVVSVWW